MTLDSKIPPGPLEKKWEYAKAHYKLVNPANKRKYDVIVVGAGLAGAAAAASMSELFYYDHYIVYHDAPRLAHSIAAQGDINAAKNYQNDGDSVYRLFYDTVKGGDYRSREENVYRLAQLSVNIIDQAVAQGVPFAREYGGLLENRSFGGVQVSRTFYARGQTGQQLLLGAFQALERQIALERVKMFPRHEMLDVVLVDGQAKGIVTRNLVTGTIMSYAADAVVLATGGYANVFYLSTNAKASNATAIWRAKRLGRDVIEERYGNLFEMYADITAEDPYAVPMRIYPAPHYTMGGLWVDYNLMSTIPGLYVGGEANFSDHGANRLGASALMQGLADGYFVLPVTIGDFLAAQLGKKVSVDRPEFKQAH